MAATHPAAGETMTRDRYMSLPHLKVTADAVGAKMIDEALQRLGLRRNIIMSVPSWFETRRVVLETDLIAVVPRHWTADPAFIACCNLSLEGIVLSIELIWHARDDQGPGICWLRGSITNLLAALPSRIDPKP